MVLLPWVIPAVNFPEAILVDVGVDFGRGEVRVTQKLLNDAQVRAPGQQVCRETVP